jgi:hypothetical protein
MAIPARDKMVTFLTRLFSTAVNSGTAIGDNLVVDRTEAIKLSGIKAETARVITAVCEKRLGKPDNCPLHDVVC